MDLKWKRAGGISKNQQNNGDISQGTESNSDNDVEFGSLTSINKTDKEGFLKKVAKNTGAGKKNFDYQSATVIRRKIIVRGDITGDENLIIEGKHEGRIILKGDLYVAQSGLIDADVDAKNVYIAGKINGNVYASQKVEIESSGILNGDIKCPKVIVTEGAVLRGNIDMNYEGLELAKKKLTGKKGSDDIIHLGPVGQGKPISLEDGNL